MSLFNRFCAVFTYIVISSELVARHEKYDAEEDKYYFIYEYHRTWRNWNPLAWIAQICLMYAGMIVVITAIILDNKKVLDFVDEFNIKEHLVKVEYPGTQLHWFWIENALVNQL